MEARFPVRVGGACNGPLILVAHTSGWHGRSPRLARRASSPHPPPPLPGLPPPSPTGGPFRSTYPSVSSHTPQARPPQAPAPPPSHATVGEARPICAGLARVCPGCRDASVCALGPPPSPFESRDARAPRAVSPVPVVGEAAPPPWPNQPPPPHRPVSWCRLLCSSVDRSVGARVHPGGGLTVTRVCAPTAGPALPPRRAACRPPRRDVNVVDARATAGLPPPPSGAPNAACWWWCPRFSPRPPPLPALSYPLETFLPPLPPPPPTPPPSPPRTRVLSLVRPAS